jgi:hypothetical protein
MRQLRKITNKKSKESMQNFGKEISWEATHGKMNWKWEHNIKMDLRETYCETVKWIEMYL